MGTETTENTTLLACRACMQFTSTMYPFFDEYEAGISMASILQSYLQYKINDHANLPNQVCEDCAVTLIKFHNFIVIYRDTQSKFRKWQGALDEDENNLADSHDEDVSLGNEQITIHALGAEEENSYTLEIQSEDTQNNLDYIEESEDIVQVQNEENIEETISITFDDQSEGYEINLRTDIAEKITQYHCSYCNDVFLYIEMLSSHIIKNHNIPTFEGAANTSVKKRRIFTDNDDGDPDYIDNMSNISYFGMHSCKLCGKSFPKIKSLNIHEGSHKRNKRYTILNDGDSEAGKQFICDVCGRSFKKKAYLNDHVEIHDRDRRLHNCPICHKQFKGRSNFSRHKRFHFEAKNQHICEICGVGFTLRSTLKTHFYLKHVRERNFQCLICSQFFSLKSTLEKHVKRHQNREGTAQALKYPCLACNMKYLDKSSLKRHIELKHSAEKFKFECVDCDKDYTTYSNLAKHRLKKHPEKPLIIARKREPVLFDGVLVKIENNNF